MPPTNGHTIRGPQPNSAHPNQDWYDAFLEAKQQHRFWCFWPVYMPLIGTNINPGVSEEGDVRYDTATIAKQLKPTRRSIGSTTAKSTRELLLAGRAAAATRDGDSSTASALRGASRRQRVSKATQEALVKNAIHKRISPHIVTSFTPPSYGAAVTEQPMAGRKVSYARGVDATAKIQEATISFVSTLTDDLNFSLNLAFQVGNRGNTSVATELFPFWLWPELTSPVLTVLDLSSRPDPANLRSFRPAGTQGRDLNVQASDPGALPPIPVGAHEFVRPLITNIQFSEYSYGGTALLQTTVSIKVASPQNYRYAVLTSPFGGLGTRFPTSVDEGSSYMSNGDPNHAAPRMLDAVIEAYGNHPMAFARRTRPELAMTTAKETYRQVQSLAGVKRNTYMAKVNEIMGDSDTAGIVDRKGKLLPLLKPWPGPDPDPMRVPSSAPQATLSDEVTEAAVTTDEERANTHRATEESIDRAMETSRGIPDPDDPTTGGEAATIGDDVNTQGGQWDPTDDMERPQTPPPEVTDREDPATDPVLYNEQSSDNDFEPLATGGAEAPYQGPGSGAGQPIDWDTPTGPGTSGPSHDLPEEDFPDQPDDVLPED